MEKVTKEQKMIKALIERDKQRDKIIEHLLKTIKNLNSKING